MNENRKIYKVGYSYFSTLKNAEEYRRKFYRSYPYIETIILDRGLTNVPVVEVYWRCQGTGIEAEIVGEPIFYVNTYRDDNQYLKNIKFNNRIIKFSMSDFGNISIGGSIIVSRAIEIRKISKDKSIDTAVREAFTVFKKNGLKPYSIKI